MIKYAIGAAAAIALIAAIYMTGHSAGADKVQARWDAAEAAHAAASLEISEQHRATEKRLSDDLQRVTDELTQQQLATTEDLHRTVADLNSDTLRLRKRFQGCERKLSGATGSAGPDDGAPEAGLSKADQALLVRTAARADGYAHQLIACQAYITNLRKPKNRAGETTTKH